MKHMESALVPSIYPEGLADYQLGAPTGVLWLVRRLAREGLSRYIRRPRCGLRCTGGPRVSRRFCRMVVAGTCLVSPLGDAMTLTVLRVSFKDCTPML